MLGLIIYLYLIGFRFLEVEVTRISCTFQPSPQLLRDTLLYASQTDHPVLARLLALIASLTLHSAVAQPGSPSPTGSQALAPNTTSHAARVSQSLVGQCFRRPPEYPAESLRSGQEGRSLVAFNVTEEGDIADPALYRSSSHKLLDQAAIAHLNACIASFEKSGNPLLPTGLYVLPLVWRIE